MRHGRMLQECTEQTSAGTKACGRGTEQVLTVSVKPVKADSVVIVACI
jgi:hypothetical protein